MVKKIVLSFIFMISSIICILAEDQVIVNLFTAKKSIGIDEGFQINLEVVGSSGNVSIDDMGEIDSSIFIRPAGTVSNMSLRNGSIKTSLTMVFYVKISKQGSYNIGPITINIKDQKYKSNILEINVASSSTQNISSNQNYENNYENDEINSNQDYLLELNSNKKEAYVNEPIDLSVNFFMAFGIKPKNYQTLTFPSTAWIENYTSEDNCIGLVRINNRNYTQYELEKERIFISKTGTYTIDPAIIDFYGIKTTNSYSNYEPMTLKTNMLNIKIKPLPDNPPEGFSGAVGEFQLVSNLNKLKLNTKESTTLEISLSGSGNFQNINDIEYMIDNSIEQYSSSSRIESDKYNKKKVWEILLVPTMPGKFKVQVKDFHYFDIVKKEYVTIKGQEYILKVESNKKVKSNEKIATRKENLENNVGSNLQAANLNNINYIQIIPGNKNIIFSYKLWYRMIIYFYILLFLLIILFILFKYMIFNKRQKNHISECKNAYKYFSHDIVSLKKDIDTINYQKCTCKISNVMEKYFIKKFKIDSVEFTKKGIDKKLSTFLSEDHINNLKEIILKLDMIRFGGEEISPDDCKKLIDKIKRNIENIEVNNKK